MDLSAMRDEREATRRLRRRRSAALAGGAALLLLFLTAGVFSVALTSREVASESSRVHALDQMLSSAAIARTQWSFGLVLSELPPGVIANSAEAAESSQLDVDTALETFILAERSLDEDLGGVELATAVQIAEFIDLVREATQEDGVGVTTGSSAVRLNASYSALADRLVEERSASIDAVEDADGRLSRLSSLVSFLTAFVIPTAAIIIYRLLATPQRAVLEAEARSIREGVHAGLRRDLLFQRLERLKASVSGDGSETGVVSPVQQIEDIWRLQLTLEQAQRCEFVEVDVAALLGGEQSEGPFAGSPRKEVITSGPGVALSDPDVLTLLIASIHADCRARGATRVTSTVAPSAEGLQIVFEHDGARRSDLELRNLFDQATITGRINLLAGADVDLAAAIRLAEDLQGHIETDMTSGGQVIFLHLPAPALPRPDRERVVSLPSSKA